MLYLPRCHRIAVGLFLLGGFAIAHAQTSPVPLNTLTVTDGPRTGTLSNGVTWNVDNGSAWFEPPLQVDSGPGRTGGHAGYYGFRPNGSSPFGPDQTWDFNHQQVNLSFVVNGLQGAGEGIRLPIGTQCTIPVPAAADFTWTPATGILVHKNSDVDSDGGVGFECTLDNVTSLHLVGADSNPASNVNRRGLRELKVTIPMSVSITGIPANISTGDSAQGEITCTNNGPNVTHDVTCTPSVPASSGSISNVVCTPNTPVALLPPGASSAIKCAFTYTAPATAVPTVTISGVAVSHYGTVPPATASMLVTSGSATTSVTPVDVRAAISGIPSDLAPGSLTQGVLTCTNQGAGPASNVNCVPSVPAGSGSISNVVCTPSMPVTSLLPGAAIQCAFTYAAPATPGVSSVTITGTASTIVGGTPVTNTSSMTANITPAALVGIKTKISGIPPMLAPGASVQGTLTCTNQGTGPASNVNCVPSVPAGSGSISNVVCTPSTPVASLAAGSAVVCTFTLTAPSTGSSGPIVVTGTPSTTTPGLVMMPMIVTTLASVAAIPSLGFASLVLLSLVMGGLVLLSGRKFI